MPTPPAPRIGDIVEIYCSRCRLNLDASIAAVVNGEIAKLTCRTCNTEVKYKPPANMQDKKQKAIERLMNLRQAKRDGPALAPPPPPTPVRQLWDDLTANVDSRRAKVYDRTRTYAPNDALLHKEHGMGVIEAVGADGELNVLFRDGFVRLPSNRPRDEE